MSVRILVDADVPKAIVERLRADGHDVLYAATELPPRTPDATILVRAVDEGRLLIVADKDCSGYIYQDRLAAPSGGIVYLRLPNSMRPEERAQLVSELLRDYSAGDFAGHFVTVRGTHHARFRPLPN
jgi:hypothetical protein